MTHRAEQILTAIESILTGLPTTGANIERGRIWAVEDCPAIAIDRSHDLPADNGLTLQFQNRELEIIITAYVKSITNQETALAQIAAEVYAALFADITQGLSFIENTTWLGDAAPKVDQDTETRTASMEMTYRILYRHSITTTEA